MTDPASLHAQRQLEAVRLIVIRLAVAVSLALLALALAAPVLDQEEERADRADQHFSLFGVIGQFEKLDNTFGGAMADAHPFAVGWGLPLVQWGTVLLVLSVLGAVAAVLTAWFLDETWPKIAVRVSCGLMIVTTIAVWFGASMLPESRYDVETTPAWGLWLPIAAGFWVLLNHPAIITAATDPPIRRHHD